MAVETGDLSNVLKIQYLKAIQNFFNYRYVALGWLERKPLKLQGSNAVFPARTSETQGVGAGTEMAALPTAGKQEFIQPSFTTKNLRGRIQVGEKAMQISMEKWGSYIPAWRGEIKSAMNTFRQYVAMQIYGDGHGKLAKLPAADNQVTITVDCAQGPDGNHLAYKNARADLIDATDDTTKLLDSTTIASRTKTTVTVAVAPAGTAADDYFVREDSLGNHFEGFQSIVNTANPDNGNYGGVDRTTEDYWQGQQASGAALTIDDLNTLYDTIQDERGAEVNMILTRSNVERMVFNILHPQVRYEVVDLGRKGLEMSARKMMFKGSPVVSDTMVWENSLFMLCKKHWHLGQLAPMGWLQRDGSVVHMIAGYPGWEAVLVWYPVLICRDPGSQGRLHSITEAP